MSSPEIAISSVTNGSNKLQICLEQTKFSPEGEYIRFTFVPGTWYTTYKTNYLSKILGENKFYVLQVYVVIS